MKKISRRELARVTARQLLDGKNRTRLMRELAAYLIENKMTNQVDMVLDDIATELEVTAGHTAAHLRVARALPATAKHSIEAYVKAMTGARSVELDVSEDASLIGGVVIRTPQYEYDASLRHKLHQLARGEAS